MTTVEEFYEVLHGRFMTIFASFEEMKNATKRLRELLMEAPFTTNVISDPIVDWSKSPVFDEEPFIRDEILNSQTDDRIEMPSQEKKTNFMGEACLPIFDFLLGDVTTIVATQKGLTWRWLAIDSLADVKIVCPHIIAIFPEQDSNGLFEEFSVDKVTIWDPGRFLWRMEGSAYCVRLMCPENSHEIGSSMSKDTDIVDGEGKQFKKSAKCRSRINKVEYPLDCGADADADQHCQGVSSSREEKVSSLKTGLVHVARKMPKNAHAHFILGLMYQRMGQPQKAVLSYEKAAEILLRSEGEIDRPEFLSLVQIHHAQCLLLGSSGDCNSERELETKELDELLCKLKESVKSNIR